MHNSERVGIYFETPGKMGKGWGNLLKNMYEGY
jgi:hypothetical protein